MNHAFVDGNKRKFFFATDTFLRLNLLVRRLPYGVLYAEADEEIFVVAVMHLSRDPKYWKHRI